MKELNESEIETLKIQLEGLIDKRVEPYTNILSVLSFIRHELNIYWAGLYWAGNNSLQLGPFQGLPACTVIQLGKGVCGAAALQKKTIVVPDVTKFPGYISCHSETKSEVVVPGVSGDDLLFVMDVDSVEYNFFSDTCVFFLEYIADLFVKLLK